MRRGLKSTKRGVPTGATFKVTPNSPMRRGLKFASFPWRELAFWGHTEFPDEEGTEIEGASDTQRGTRAVTPNSPMRRGLKSSGASGRIPGDDPVTPNSPMRRGLKWKSLTRSSAGLSSSHRIPR